MKDYLNEVNDLYPVRRSKEQKEKFLSYVTAELGAERVKRELLEKEHNNIVIGDPLKANIVFTAHYDTPAASLVPNMLIPANKILGTLINCLYPVVMSLVMLVMSLFLSTLFGLDERITIIIYPVLYLGGFYCTTRLFPNEHNKNDNTSGVATVLSLASKINNDRVAFVLFDNEEKGLLGSKAMNKKYKSELENKLIINFDCVGNGDQIIFTVKEKAEERPEFLRLKETVDKDGDFEIQYIPFKKSNGSSDHKSFPCSIGVSAGSRARLVEFYTGRIHTSRDTVASNKNIRFLTEQIKKII